MEVVRAEETWQQAAAYYVRIDSMVKDFDIPVNYEIDGHDGPETKYIVVFDGRVPIATCRLYFPAEDTAKIERVVVSGPYRKQGIGRQAVQAAEDWIRELGYKKIVISSRDVAVGFYEKLGYTADWSKVEGGGVFTCIYTSKEL